MLNVNDLKVIAIIPSRLHSTRFPKKPLATILGKPLIQHVYEKALLCKIFHSVHVATDHEEIASLVESFNGNVIMTSKNCPNGTERVAEALKNTPALQDASIIVNIQGDHPHFSKNIIESIVTILQNDPKAVMSTAATVFQTQEDAKDPNNVKCVLDQEGNALYFSRSNIPYGKVKNRYHHLGIYAYRKEFLLSYAKLISTPLQEAEDLEQLKVLEYGYRMKVAIVNERILGIDTPKDIEKMEKILCQ